jgi:hypothetical protein
MLQWATEALATRTGAKPPSKSMIRSASVCRAGKVALWHHLRAAGDTTEDRALADAVRLLIEGLDDGAFGNDHSAGIVQLANWLPRLAGDWDAAVEKRVMDYLLPFIQSEAR